LRVVLRDSFLASKRGVVYYFKNQVAELAEEDRTLVYGDMGNYSITGFQVMLKVSLMRLRGCIGDPNA
jgi:hypothetical protein